MNSFFSSQFNYCCLTWVFHNRSLNHKINRLHERCPRVIYNDSHSSYDELLNLGNSVSIHHRNLQILATEMFRVYTGSATDILNELFPLKPPSNYNLRNQSELDRNETYKNCTLWIEFFGIFRVQNMGTANE